MKHRRIMRTLAVFCLVSALWIAGCTTPDTQPFADSTATIAQGVRKIGQVTDTTPSQTNLVVNGQTIKPSHEKHPIGRYRKAWTVHLEAVEALEIYSAALAEIGTANRMASVDAENVITPLMRLSSYVNSAGVGLPVSEAGNLAKLILQTVNEIRAFKSMAKTVDKTHPVFIEIAPIISKGLTEAYKSIYEPSLNIHILAIEEKNNNMAIKYRIALALLDNKEESFLDPNTENKDEVQKEIDVLKSRVERLAIDYNKFKDEVAAEHARHQATEELYNTTMKGLKKWLDAHTALRNALNEKLQPNFTAIMTRAQEIKTAAETLREKL